MCPQALHLWAFAGTGFSHFGHGTVFFGAAPVAVLALGLPGDFAGAGAGSAPSSSIIPHFGH
jgi:hypothetical protein